MKKKKTKDDFEIVRRVEKRTSGQYIGANCKVLVNVGDKVFKSSVIAVNSNNEKIYSINEGIVKKIASKSILIESEVVIEEKIPIKPVQEEPVTKEEEKAKEEPKDTDEPSTYVSAKSLSDQIKSLNGEVIKSRAKAFFGKPNPDDASRKSVPALDGLRTLAVFAVIFYHLSFGWAKGGLLGVTVFFVLSGYLIAGLLKKEIEDTKTIKFWRFWLHRIRRLFPAIVCVVVVVALLCVIFNHILLTKMRPDIIPSLFWFQNWWYIFRDMSYFDSLGDPSPLVHFWSLAIEEQFYIVFPLFLFAAYKFGWKRKFIRRIFLFLAFISASAMVLLYDPLLDPTRVYYGTDTRAFSLLLGAWLAFVWPWQKLGGVKNDFKVLIRTKQIKIPIPAFDIAGFIALISLIFIMAFVDGLSVTMYYGVILLASILSMIIIASLVLPKSWLSQVFAWGPLVWIGQRSYGMYLWHFPIILLFKPLVGEGTDTWWFAILAIAILVIVSALQYKFIENPIRQGAIGHALKQLKRKNFKRVSRYVCYCAASLVIIIPTIIGVMTIEDETLVPEEAIEETNENAEKALVVQGQLYPLLVADSVTGAIKFNVAFPYGLNDSAVGRNINQAIIVLTDYAQRGCLSNCVVVSCFSNHEIRDGDLDQIYSIVGPDRDLFLVTPCTPYPACWTNIALLQQFGEAHENVHIVDWCSKVSVNLDRYLYKDHIHLNLEGQILYVQMLAEAINPYLPDQAKCDTLTVDQRLTTAQ